MRTFEEPLTQHICEQIALEEHLCKLIEQQISELNETDFNDAKDLLIQTKQILNGHFLPLNEKLDDLEIVADPANVLVPNGDCIKQSGNGEVQRKNWRISRILRDDYAALNLIIVSNSILHTAALAMGAHEVAALALTHLKNLASVVVRIGAVIPEVITRELRAVSSGTDLSVAQVALENIKLVWRNAR